MYNLLNYMDLRDIMLRQFPALDYSFNNIEKIIDINKVEKCYCKNLFKEVYSQELYLFTNGKIIKVVFSTFKIEIYNSKDVKSVTVEIESSNHFTLKIEIENMLSIELDSFKDSNEPWQYKYIDYIFDIANYLAN